jgi:Flp pilus assembly pilin Flp
MQKVIAHLVWDDQGQDLIEYVLIGSFVSIAVLTAATALGTQLSGWYQAVANWAQAAAGKVAGS